MDATGRRTAVIGAGAIGGLLGAYLTEAGEDVVLVDPWFRHVEAMRQDGLHVVGPDEEIRSRVQALHVDELGALRTPVDVVFIGVKSYDTEWAVRLMEPYLAPDGFFVSTQNGINEERLLDLVPCRRIVGCVVTVAAEIFEPGLVRRTLGREWHGFTVGELDGRSTERVEELADLMAATGPVHVSTNMWGEFWSKLTLNSMTNASGGITGYTTHHLWSDPHLVDLSIRIAGETAAVCEKLGYRMEPVFGRIDPGVLVAGHRGNKDARAQAAAQLDIIGQERVGARENKPSLLQDVIKQRRTEIEYLNGYVARRGREVGIPTPANNAVAALVREIERGRLAPDPANLRRLENILPDCA